MSGGRNNVPCTGVIRPTCQLNMSLLLQKCVFYYATGFLSYRQQPPAFINTPADALSPLWIAAPASGRRAAEALARAAARDLGEA